MPQVSPMQQSGRRYVRCGRFLLDERTAHGLYGWAWILFFLGCLLSAILVPISYHYISYDEQCYVKNKFGTVDVSTLYTQQAKFLTLNYDVVCFPSTFQTIYFTAQRGDALNVATSDGFSFNVDVQFNYLLRADTLVNIYTRYGMGFERLISNNARVAIKGISVLYKTEDYVLQKDRVTNAMYLAVMDQVRDVVDIDIPREHFLLLSVYFPETFLEQNLQSTIQIQDNQIQQQQQIVNRIIYETQILVSQIDAQTTFALDSAKSNATTIVSNAQAEAVKLVSLARNQGQQSVVQSLNLTNVEKFLRYSSLLQTKEVQMIVGATSVSPIVK